MMNKYSVKTLASACLLFLFFSPLISQSVYQEKIFIHTDRALYHAGELMWMKVYVAEATSSEPGRLSSVVYIQLLDSSGASVSESVINIKNGRGRGALEIPGNLHSSIYTVVAFTRWMRNFGPENLYSKPISVINGYGAATILSDNNVSSGPDASELQISISADEGAYDNRRPVNLSIATVDKSGKPVSANLSVSVYLVDTATMPLQQNIVHAFRNKPEPSSFSRSFAADFRGQWITGTLIDSNNAPAKNVAIYLVIPGYASGFHNTQTDDAGRFSLQMNDGVISDSVLILTNPLIGSGYVIQVDNPFINVHPENFHNRLHDKTNPRLSELARNVAEIRQAFNVPSYLKVHSICDTMPFYGHHDLSYNLDDYTRFGKMEEVFREFVRFVTVHRRGGRFHLNVFNDAYQSMFDSDPLVLIDGYPVFDINRLFEFDPLKLQHVQVVTRRFFRGTGVFNGIINLVTYTRNLNSFETDRNAISLKKEIAQPEKKFVSPRYDSDAERKNRMPDFRTLMHWEPDVITDSTGKSSLNFFTSDLTGVYIIEVNGQTNDGKCGSARKLFTVQRRR